MCSITAKSADAKVLMRLWILALAVTYLVAFVQAYHVIRGCSAIATCQQR